MKNKTLGFLLFFLAGCKLFPEGGYRSLPYQQDAELLRQYEYQSHIASSVIYEIKVSALPSYSDQSDISFFFEEEFAFEGDGNFQVLEFGTESLNSAGNSSTVLLLDQSGSYLEVDPHNNRTKAINKFMEDIQSPHNSLVGGFSEGGGLATEPVEYAGDFENTWQNQEFLFGLATRTGGTSPLYDAVDSALDKLIAASSPNKNVVVMLHAADTGSTSTMVDLVTKAVSNSIKIHLLIFGELPDPGEVWDLADQTGGLLATCPVDADLITIFAHLNRLLTAGSTVYKIRVQFTPSGGNVLSGNEYVNRIRIADSFSDYEFNPVYVKIKIP